MNSLRPCAHNARIHSKRQIRQIAESIKSFGFTNPVLTNNSMMIVAGHGRFEIPEIDTILEEQSQTVDEDDEVPIATGRAVTHEGDLWELGKHRIYCGNSLHEDSFKTLLGSRKAAVVFSDPPYNVSIDGNVCGKGSIHHREFEMAAGEMTETDFMAFLERSMRLLARYTTSGSIHFLCMGWRHMRELLAAGNEVYKSLLKVCVWVKDNEGMGSFYRSRHEVVFVFRNGAESHRNNVQLGRFGRNRSNVWEYPGVNTPYSLKNEIATDLPCFR